MSFVDSYIVFRVSVADLKRLKINMKIKIMCFKVLRWPKKNHHSTIKTCHLQIWKKRCTLDGNLNMYYIWQNKVMNFLQILFKRQRLIVVLVLVILYCFEATCLIIFCCLIFGIASFFEGITNIMTGQYFLLEFFTPFYIHSINSIISAQKGYI